MDKFSIKVNSLANAKEVIKRLKGSKLWYCFESAKDNEELITFTILYSDSLIYALEHDNFEILEKKQFLEEINRIYGM